MIVEQSVTITNKLGLHARAAAKFVTLAGHYQCEVFILRNNTKVNAKSIMGVMMLAASKGTELTLQTSGEDAEQAATALTSLINDGFGESE